MVGRDQSVTFRRTRCKHCQGKLETGQRILHPACIDDFSIAEAARIERKKAKEARDAAKVAKAAPVRSEAYRRLVASLPCAYCGIEGYSQHAHENDGKGARLKVDDRRAMPLCCSRPGIEGCHVAFDQYRLVPGGRDAHADLGRALAEQTRNRLNALGLWPAGVPHLNDQQP